MADRPYEDVRIEGHLIDSLMVPQIMDDVMDLEGEFEILSFDVGRTKTDISHAVFRIYGRDLPKRLLWRRSILSEPGSAGWTIWQYRSTGEVGGIRTMVDLNLLDAAALERRAVHGERRARGD